MLCLLISFVFGILSFSEIENIISFLYFVRLFTYFVFFFYLLYHLKKDKSSKTQIEVGLKIFVGLTVIFSVVQYFLYPNLRNIAYLGWDPHQFRLFGLFFDTSVSGAVYGLVFLFILLQGKKFIKSETQRSIVLGIFLLFVVLTFSRSLFLGFSVTTILAALRHKWHRELVMFSALFLFLLFAVPKPGGEGVNLARMFSLKSRLNDYRVALDIWRKNPLVGVGYNRIRYVKLKLNTEEETQLAANHAGAAFHSSFLIILVTGGLLGLVLFSVVLYEFASLGQTSMFLTLFVSILSSGDNILLHPFVLFLFLIYISLVTSEKISLFDKKQ